MQPAKDDRAYIPEIDAPRFKTQESLVLETMVDGKWRSPYEICEETGIKSPSSVCSRLRDLRLKGYKVSRRRRNRGTHEYQIISGQLLLF